MNTASPLPQVTRTDNRHCRLGTKCKRVDCNFDHPHGRDIDQISPTTTNHEYERAATSDMIGTIEELLARAIEQQMEFDVNNYEGNDDNEQALDILQKNALKELRSQRNEFQLAIDHLTAEFNSLMASTVDNENKRIELQPIKKQLERELKRWHARLPIYARRSEIIEKVRTNQVLVLKADTGSGKSTQTVQYLCDAHFAEQSKSQSLVRHCQESELYVLEQIICTQPRKLAARSLAARVAEEYGCKVGEEVSMSEIFHVLLVCLNDSR